MDIKSGRMVFLGYGKYWRSDRIVGLVPIGEDRGPGRRTDVFVEDRAQPIVASRTEDAILADLGATTTASNSRRCRRRSSSSWRRSTSSRRCCAARSCTSTTSTSRSGRSGWARC